MLNVLTGRKGETGGENQVFQNPWIHRKRSDQYPTADNKDCLQACQSCLVFDAWQHQAGKWDMLLQLPGWQINIHHLSLNHQVTTLQTLLKHKLHRNRGAELPEAGPKWPWIFGFMCFLGYLNLIWHFLMGRSHLGYVLSIQTNTHTHLFVKQTKLLSPRLTSVTAAIHNSGS